MPAVLVKVSGSQNKAKRYWAVFLNPNVLVRDLLLETDTMTKASLIKDNILLGLAYRFRSSAHYHQGGNMTATRHAESSTSSSEGLKVHTHIDTPSNSCTPWAKHIQTMTHIYYNTPHKHIK